MTRHHGRHDRMLPSSLLVVLLLVVSDMCRTSRRVVHAAAAASPSASGDDGFTRLVAWMRRHGGRVDPRINVAEMNGVRGVVALAAIEEGTELLRCPWKLVIGSSSLQDQMQVGDDMCQVVKDMAAEIRLGSESLWWPYLEHIQIPRLAAMWEQSALDELQGIPPSEDTTRHLQWFSQNCAGNLDQEEDMRSLVSFVSRASEVGMVPIYDLLNHHNGKKNAKLSLTEEGVSLLVVSGPIQQGEELHLSYGVKTAPTMYRDYGFVEEWPCCWNWKDATSGDNFAFVLFPDGVAAISPTRDFLKLIWHSSVRMTISDFQASATRHMESLPLSDLERFAQAARHQLDGLPTTLREDLVIIVQKKELLAQTLALGDAISIEDDASRTARDVISAVEYRIAFKKALWSALTSSEAAAQTIVGTLSRQEL